MDELLLHFESFCTKDCFIILRQFLISLCVPEPLQEPPYFLSCPPANDQLPRGMEGGKGVTNIPAQHRHGTRKSHHGAVEVIPCGGCTRLWIYFRNYIFLCLHFCSQWFSQVQRGTKVLHLQKSAYIFWWLSVMMWEKSFLQQVSLDRNNLCSLCDVIQRVPV